MGSPYTDAEIGEITRRWEAGESADKIADALGRENAKAIWNKIRRMGLGRRRVAGRRAMPRKIDAEGERLLVALRAGGASNKEIAAELGVSKTTVETWVRRLHLPLPPRVARTKPAPVPKAKARPVVERVVVREAVARTVPLHPFWTPERDALILGAKGHYSALAPLAKIIGRPYAALLQRWHQLRST